jgi:hypothetical protein
MLLLANSRAVPLLLFLMRRPSPAPHGLKRLTRWRTGCTSLVSPMSSAAALSSSRASFRRSSAKTSATTIRNDECCAPSTRTADALELQAPRRMPIHSSSQMRPTDRSSEQTLAPRATASLPSCALTTKPTQHRHPQVQDGHNAAARRASALVAVTSDRFPVGSS